MAVDKNTSGGPGAPAEDETPDWTTWLRSRLERVVAPERKSSGDPDDDPSATLDDTPQSGSDGFDHPVLGGHSGAAAVADAVGAGATLAGQVEALAEATAACRAMIEEQAATGERLAAWVQELATVQADDERWAVAVGRVVDAADEERRAADEQVAAALATLTSRVERIEEGLRRISGEMAGLRRGLARPAPTAVKLAEPQLQAVAARIAAAMAGPVASSAAAPGRRDAPPADGGGAAVEPSRRRPRRTASLRAVPPGPPTRRA